MSARTFCFRVLLAWSLAFDALIVYWDIAEAEAPGQQYADPLGPCAYLASWPALLIGALLSGRWAAYRAKTRDRRV